MGLRKATGLDEDHHAGCPALRTLFGTDCNCGASAAAIQRIVHETCAEFGEELMRIMAREPVSQEEMDRPRFFPSKVRPNGIQNAKRIRARLGQA